MQQAWWLLQGHRKNLLRLPNDHVEADSQSIQADPIYEDLESSVQDLDVVATDIQRKDDTTHKVNVEVSIQKPKDVDTKVKMEDNPAYDVTTDHKTDDRNMQSSMEGLKDSIITGDKMEAILACC